MIVCLHGGPSFLSKMLPVAGLTSNFLEEIIELTNDAINSAGGKIIAIICDGNRINKKCMKSFKTVAGKPWLTTDGRYLLFDFVHLVKCIRNNWLTEKTGELVYIDGEKTRTAKWSHLKMLREFESADPLTRLSSLTDVSVTPRPIERQKVAHALSVFSERTYTALLTHPKMKDVDGVEDTSIFIKKVVQFWRIMNVKGKGADIRHNNPLEKVIDDPNDPRLTLLENFGEMALQMSTSCQGKRVKQLTKDTALALHHTCYGVVDLTRFLLSTSHKYVPLTYAVLILWKKPFRNFAKVQGGHILYQFNK